MVHCLTFRILIYNSSAFSSCTIQCSVTTAVSTEQIAPNVWVIRYRKTKALVISCNRDLIRPVMRRETPAFT